MPAWWRPLLKFLTHLSQLADFVGDGKIDQNAAYNRNSYKSAAVRREVSKIAEENWGVPGSFGTAWEWGWETS